MNSTPSAPYPPPSRDAFPMSQPGMPQPGMPQPGMPQPGMSQPEKPQPGMPQPGMPQPVMPQPGMPQPEVPSYGISVPQSGASQDGWSSPNMICPPGLEYLIALDYLGVQQQEEQIEVLEIENKYHVTKANGQQLYHIQEESHWCALLCLGSSREFRVVDTNQREILHMVQPYSCSSCCCCCCTQVLEVYSGEVLLGTVIEHRSSFLKPSLSIRDASGKTVLKIKGPCDISYGTGEFKIKSADDVHRIGEIKKEWGGCCTETFTDADNFSLRFPVDLDVKIKAVLLGACILIDYQYFEECKCGILSCLEECLQMCSITTELLLCCFTD